MNILITGGTGFIGSQLALRCLDLSYSVTVFGQENTPAEAINAGLLRERGARVVLGSVTDISLVREVLKGIDLVVHLAAVQHEMNVPDGVFRSVNVEGTRNLLEASISNGVKRFVHGSTIGVYGSTAENVDESTPCRPDNIYGITKLEGERVALSYNRGLPVVAIRIPEVYGPGDRRLLKLFSGIQRGMFVVIGSGKNLHHPIFVGDLVQGLLIAFCQPEAAGEVFLLAGKQVVSTETMVRTIAQELQAKTLPFRIPLLPMTLIATLMEKGLRPLGVQPPLHRRRIDFFRKSFQLSGKKAADVLGFAPETDFRTGVHLTAKWYRENGYLK